jgi:acetamidase/formamidase
MTLSWPRAETPTDYIAMATDEDLKVATTLAIQEMIDFLAASKNLSKHEAYQLVSIAGHVAITQLVDRPVYGVHVTMAKSIFKIVSAQPADATAVVEPVRPDAARQTIQTSCKDVRHSKART